MSITMMMTLLLILVVTALIVFPHCILCSVLGALHVLHIHQLIESSSCICEAPPPSPDLSWGSWGLANHATDPGICGIKLSVQGPGLTQKALMLPNSYLSHFVRKSLPYTWSCEEWKLPFLNIIFPFTLILKFLDLEETKLGPSSERLEAAFGKTLIS